MEFMNCIPNLESFIDKTIQKCLLEYDLDSNDTETVLDDMERAWPKTSPNPQERGFVRDCTGNGRSSDLEAHQKEEYLVLAGDDSVKVELSEEDAAIDHRDCETEETINSTKGEELPVKLTNGDRLNSKGEELTDGLTNEATKLANVSQENYVIDSSNADVESRSSPTLKHPKLKSRLQQRYFQGSKEPSYDTRHVTVDTDGDVAPKMAQPLSSDMLILASTADIHVGTQSRTKLAPTPQTTWDLQNDNPEMRLVNRAIRSYQETSPMSSQSARKTNPTNLNSTTQHSRSSFSQLSPSSHHNYKSDSSPHDYKLIFRQHDLPLKLSTTPKEGHTLTSAMLQKKITNSQATTTKDTHLNSHYQKGCNSFNYQKINVNKKCERSPSSVKNSRINESQIPTLFPNPSACLSPQTEPSTFNNLPQSQSPPQRPHQVPHNSPEPGCPHGSRIACIIAEELQKDNIPINNPPSRRSTHSVNTINSLIQHDQLTHSTRSTHSFNTINSTNRKYFPTKRTANTSERKSKSSMGDQRCPPNIETTTRLTRLENYVARTKFNFNPSTISAPFGTFGNNLHPTNKARHLDVNTDVIRNVDGISALLPTTYILSGDDQPQDLSKKPERKPGGNTPEFVNSGFDQDLGLHVRDNISRGYLSSPNSPLSSTAASRHLDLLASRMSSSPSNKSDGCCDYNSGSEVKNNHPIKSGVRRTRDQIHDFDDYNDKDSEVLVKRRTEDNVPRLPEDTGS